MAWRDKFYYFSSSIKAPVEAQWLLLQKGCFADSSGNT
jgi:hypothetical protein